MTERTVYFPGAESHEQAMKRAQDFAAANGVAFKSLKKVVSSSISNRHFSWSDGCPVNMECTIKTELSYEATFESL